MELSRSLRCSLAALCVMAVPCQVTAQVWQDLGPGRIPDHRSGSAGRVSALASHPTNPSIYYLGGADGGVWKTVDDGATWTPLTDSMPTNAIGCITVDPNNPNRVYVGTGEINRNEHTRHGLGIYRSDDGGATWAHLPRSGGVHVESTLDGRCIGRICIDPSNSNHLLAAVIRSPGDRNGKRHPYGENAEGLYRSLDAGETWTRVALSGTTVTWGCTDVVHVSGSTFLAAVWRDEPGITSARIYRSVNGGGNWTQVGGTFSRRIALAVGTGGSVVWALDSTSSTHRLWRSADGGQNWTQFVSRTTSNGLHMHVLAVNPSDHNKVYFGGQYNNPLNEGKDDLVRVVWPDNQTFTPCGAPHEDHRSIAWRCDGRLMVGTDGGIEVSINNDPTEPGDAEDLVSPGHWLDRSSKSLGITQVVPGIAVDPADDRLVYAGTQDNGSVRRVTLDPLETRIWDHTMGGDGGPHVVDTYGPAQHSRVLQIPFNGNNLAYSDDTGDSWVQEAAPLSAGRKYNQFVLDASSPDDGPRPLYFARDPLTLAVWDDGYSYIYLPADPPYSIRGLAVGPHQGDNQRIYATYNNNLLDSNDAGFVTNPSYIAISDDGETFNPNKPTAPSSDFQHWTYGARDIALDPANADVAFCVSSRWRTNTVLNRVFFTTNGGLTWTGRDGGTTGKVTPAPINAVTVISLGGQRRVVVGTDQGVWISINDGLTWGKYGTGLPNSSVTDVLYDAVRGKIFVGMLGRGVGRSTTHRRWRTSTMDRVKAFPTTRLTRAISSPSASG